MRTQDDSRPFRTRHKRRVLTRDELLLWQRATADVRPILPAERLQPGVKPDGPSGGAAGTDPVAMPDPQSEAAAAVSPGPGRRRPPASHREDARPRMAELTPGIAPGIDIRTLMRLRRGLMAPQAEIDLHQCTQAEAHARLIAFLIASQARGRRCVLVITGKGYGPGGAVGVLKTMVPRWLNEQPVRLLVMAFAHAIPQHGGEGALYIMLRRQRDRG